MLRDRLAIAQSVADQLAAAERANDEAIASTARLIAQMMEARIQINAAVCVGQPAFEAAASVFEMQAGCRRRLVEAHGALNDAKRLVGLGEHAIGGLGDKEVKPIKGLARIAAVQNAA